MPVKQQEIAYARTTIGVDAKDRKVSKFEVVYSKFQETNSGKKAAPSSLVGPKITATRTGDRFTFTATPKLTPANLKELDEEFNKANKMENEDLLPKKAVRVKDTWDVESSVLKKAFTDPSMPALDVSQGSMKGKFIKAYKKDDKQYGVIEFELDIPFKATAFQGLQLQDGSKLTGTMTIDCCIDGSTIDEQITGTIIFEMNLKGPSGAIQSQVKLDTIGIETETK